MRSDSFTIRKDFRTYVGMPLYGISRLALGAIIHPVATFKFIWMVGDSEENLRRAISLPRLPKLPIGRQRFQN